MRKIYQKYKDWFVVGLLMLFCFKSCQSCSKSRTIEFNDKKNIELINSINTKNSIIVDSLKQDIYILNDSIDHMNTDIQIYLSKIQSLEGTIDIYKDENQNLKANNKHYRNTNQVLVNTNKQIINKEN